MKWSEIMETHSGNITTLNKVVMPIIRRVMDYPVTEGTGLNYDLLASDIWNMAKRGNWPDKAEGSKVAHGYLWSLLIGIKKEALWDSPSALASAMRDNVGTKYSKHDQDQYWEIRRYIDSYRDRMKE